MRGRPPRLTALFGPPRLYRPSRSTFATSYQGRYLVARPHPSVHCPHHTSKLESGIGLSTLTLGLLAAAAAAAVWATYPYPSTTSEDPAAAPFAIMPETRQGWLGNLTPQQEAALKELWNQLGKLTHMIPPERTSTESIGDSGDAASMSPSSKKKKKRFSVFRRSAHDSDDDNDPADKHGQEKEFKQALADMSPEQLRSTIWSFCKGDNPDALLLRFLRARKWDVHNALVMLISTSHWRSQIKLDEELMPRGEAYYAAQAAGGSGDEKKLGEDFMLQMRKGKSFLHGVDKEGRPLCYVRVRLHHASDQSVEAIEKFTVYTIETARMMLRDPVDTAGVIFDMTGFSMANMDYTPVKFMIKVFEANYPESLGHICVHHSPWIFNTVWSIIKGWLDPVVASKVHFTKDADELAEFIPRANIPAELGGDEDWTYAYAEPAGDERATITAAASAPEYKAAVAERAGLVDEFEQATLTWVRGEGGDAVARRRQELAGKMAANYWRLDPYVRAPSLYDRTGVIGRAGAIDMYPGRAAKGAAAPAAPAAVSQLRAEDSDDEDGAKSFETAREV